MRRRRGRMTGQGGTISWFALGVSVVFLLPLLVVVGMSFNPGEFSVFPPRGFSLPASTSGLESSVWRQPR